MIAAQEPIEVASSDSATRPKSKEAAAKLLGVARGTLGSWIASGAPSKANGAYDVEAIRAWRAENIRPKSDSPGSAPTDIGSALAREANARAAVMEMKLQKSRGELVETEVVRGEVMQHYLLAKQHLTDLPYRICAKLRLGAKDRQRALATIQKTIDEFLSALSDAMRAVDRVAEAQAVKLAGRPGKKTSPRKRGG